MSLIVNSAYQMWQW